MSEIVLEIGTEEIPARFMPDITQQMKEKATALLMEERIPCKVVRIMGTPRRLTLYLEECSEQQDDLVKMVKGPAKKIAFDAEGNPTKAAQGFARGQGVEVSHLILKQLDRVDYVYASIKKAGKETKEVLPGILQQFVEALSFPKNMLWGKGETSFVRPIRWIVALQDDEVIPVTIAGIQADRYSRGHRFLSPGQIEIKSAQHYVETLENAYVMVDIEKRRRRILKEIEETARENKGYLEKDLDLLEEVVWLVEYPTAFCGSFNPDYLGIPREAIITPMKEHQRYFPVVDMNNQLKPLFIGVRNGAEKYIGTVTRGNEKVLVARLEDAKFFYEEDLKIPFKDMGKKLSKIVFQEKLGSYQDKVERVEALSEFIADKLGIKDEKIQICANLCKNDLNSHMVKEFTELQGIMGEYYANHAGYDKIVAQGIREHYMPRFQGDAVPSSLPGQIVAMADKLDSIVGVMGVGLIPTGSQDPYALRRAAQGILQIVLKHALDLDFSEIIDYAKSLYKDRISFDNEEIVEEFFLQRVKKDLQDKGISYDQVDAVTRVRSLRFHDTLLRARAIERFSDEDAFSILLQGIKRANNLSQKSKGIEFAANLMKEVPEQRLASALDKIEANIIEKKQSQDYYQALLFVAELKDDIDYFLENTMVMVDDESIRENRLALLDKVVSLTRDIADFSQIVEKE
ncbi:glycine--tRNA ligase subunit beta [Clostridia bacterium]|nr:glycine--tRNA ligase subunit beta [Clostridia bacterium]